MKYRVSVIATLVILSSGFNANLYADDLGTEEIGKRWRNKGRLDASANPNDRLLGGVKEFAAEICTSAPQIQFRIRPKKDPSVVFQNLVSKNNMARVMHESTHPVSSFSDLLSDDMKAYCYLSINGETRPVEKAIPRNGVITADVINGKCSIKLLSIGYELEHGWDHFRYFMTTNPINLDWRPLR